MFKLLGFIIGSAISILTILLVIGIPEFHLEDPDIDKRRFEEAVEKLKEKSLDARLVADKVAEKIVDISPENDVDVATLPPPVASEVADETPVAELPIEITLQQALEPQWHSFWNPFRSRIAAQGFVTRLEEVTGLDYRIEKLDIGVYDVSFAFVDDTERSVKLSQISAATGLDLPGS